MEYYVYAIYNRQHNKIYIGQTKNLDERLKMHNQHVIKGYTSSFSGLWEVVHSELVASRLEALKREKQLKSFRGREFIRNSIPGFRLRPVGG
jgi:putative endonuclease